jgi:hypothetical protein
LDLVILKSTTDPEAEVRFAALQSLLALHGVVDETWGEGVREKVTRAIKVLDNDEIDKWWSLRIGQPSRLDVIQVSTHA